MHDDRWLVKSSGKVLGPFTLEELIQHLRARTLSIIDEVRDPLTRWSFIREHPLLKDVVRQLRDEDDMRHESTQTTFVGRTVTMSVTETAAQEGEVTPNPVRNPAHGSRSTDPRPISAVERTIKPILAGRGYGSLGDHRVQGQIEKTQRITKNIVWTVALCALVFTGLFLLNQRRNRSVALEQARRYAQVAREQARFGQTQQAYAYMQKAASAGPLNQEDQILYSELLIHAEGKSLEALRLLGEVRNLTEPRLVRQVSIARALAYMREQRWNEAGLEINSLLSFDPQDEETLHNRALLEYYRGQHSQSWMTMTHLMDRGYRDSQLLLLKGLLALTWPEKSVQPLRVNQASDDLRRDLENNYEFQFEKSILLMNLRLHAGKIDEMLQVLNSMWIADPFDSRNFFRSLHVDQQILSWDRVFPLCERIFKTVPDHEGSRAIRSLCLFQRGDTAQALQRLDESRRQLSQSQLLAAVQALVFFQVGRNNEARALLQLASDKPLGMIAMGQICQAEKDWACAETAWQSVLANSPRNPMALFGQAFVSKQRGNDLSSREQIRRAILSSPRYRPFLESRGDPNVF